MRSRELIFKIKNFEKELPIPRYSEFNMKLEIEFSTDWNEIFYFLSDMAFNNI